jgi:hypothetical protein
VMKYVDSFGNGLIRIIHSFDEGQREGLRIDSTDYRTPEKYFGRY